MVVGPVDAGDVDEHVNQLRADLVVLHFDGRLVRGDVDLRDDIEQEGLLDLRGQYQLVKELDDELGLREHLLDDSRQRLVDGEVVDARQVVVDGNFFVSMSTAKAVLGQQPSHVLRYLVQGVELLLVLLEHV